MLRNGSDIFNQKNKKFKLKIIKKENSENDKEKEKISTISEISENEDNNNNINNEDLINQLDYLKETIKNQEKIIQEKDNKISSLAKTNERLTYNFEMINKELTDIIDKKANEQLRKNNKPNISENNDESKRIQILEKENKNILNLYSVMKKENTFLRNKLDEMMYNKENRDKYGETDYNKRKNFNNKKIDIKLEQEINRKDYKINCLHYEISELKSKINMLEKLKEMNNKFFTKDISNKSEQALTEKILKLNEVITLIKRENEDFEKIYKNQRDVITSLTSKIENYKNSNQIQINDINVVFSSMDSSINKCVIPCSKIDIFSEVEEKLYIKYPQFKYTYNVFLSGGTKISKNKTLEENNINNEMTILVILREKVGV